MWSWNAGVQQRATPKVRSPGGNRPFIGINPISISAPMESEDPLTFDSAPTAFSNNKVKQYAEDGLPPLPQGVGADAMGMPTINANDVEMLLPIGDYKGFGLAILVELLCGFLSGMPVGPKVSAMYGNSLSEKRYLSQFYMAIDIKRFVDVASFEAKEELKSFVETLRSEPPLNVDEGKPMAPGDKEKTIKAYRLTNGIPITLGDWEKFRGLAHRFGVDEPLRVLK